MRIRTYIPSDQPAVAALWTDVFGYPTPHNDPAKVIHSKLSVQPELFFVAAVNEQVVGTVMGGYDGHRGWIYSLAVNPQHRHLGIGSALMRHVEAALIALGCPRSTSRYSTPMHRWFRFTRKWATVLRNASAWAKSSDRPRKEKYAQQDSNLRPSA